MFSAIGRNSSKVSKHLLTQFSKRSAGSYVQGVSTEALRYETTGEGFRRAVEKKPDKEFLIFKAQNIRKTFSEVYEDSRRMAAGLLSLGLKKGDRVGIWGNNYYEWTVIQMATAMSGIIMVTINPSYQSSELQYTLEKVGVKALVMPKGFRQMNYLHSLIEVCPSVANGKPGVGNVHSHDLPQLKHLIIFGENEPIRGAWDFNEIWNGAGSNDRKMLEQVENTLTPDEPINIQFTSGTTGSPKAATLTHHNTMNNAYFVGLRTGFDQGNHIICIPNPLYHCFGCVLGVLNAMNHVQTCVFPSVNYQASKVLEAVHEEKCTFLYGTPTMFIDVLSSPKLKDVDVSSLQGGYLSGAPCPRALSEDLINKLNISDLYILYGSTELSPVVTCSLPSEPVLERIQSVGHVMPSTEIAIVDENGKLVPRGEKGELLARGYMTMLGYWADEDRTRQEITPSRWYKTGDTASMNADGSINIVGRTKDMIIRGGENIYPTEIEQYIHTLPYVDDVQVVGVPDDRYGEAVCAWIRLNAEYKDKITEERVLEDCKGKIAYFKIPKYILFKEEKDFPMTATGKMRKVELRSISKKLLGLETVKSHFND